MKKATIVAILLSIFVELPIWFFLLITILSKLNVDRLVWFLFWVYVPTVIISTIIAKVVAGDKE